MRTMKKDAISRHATILDREKSLTQIIAESADKVIVRKIVHKKFVLCEECENYNGMSIRRKKIWHCKVDYKNCPHK